jgi:hypothetical protein
MRDNSIHIYIYKLELYHALAVVVQDLDRLLIRLIAMYGSARVCVCVVVRLFRHVYLFYLFWPDMECETMAHDDFRVSFEGGIDTCQC